MALPKNPTEKEPEKTPEEKVLKNSVLIINHGEYTLSEPFTGQKFPSGIRTETSEITPWIQAQIDAGLFEEIK